MRDVTTNRATIDALRTELDRAWLAPVFDFGWVGALNVALRWSMKEMPPPPHLLNEVRKCFNSNIGVAATARRTGLDEAMIEEAFVALRSVPQQPATVQFGDPKPERSALVNRKPWTPKYDDKPIVVQNGANAAAEAKAARVSPSEQYPAPDQLGRAIVVICRRLELGPLNIQNEFYTYSRARAYLVRAGEGNSWRQHLTTLALAGNAASDKSDRPIHAE